MTCILLVLSIRCQFIYVLIYWKSLFICKCITIDFYSFFRINIILYIINNYFVR